MSEFSSIANLEIRPTGMDAARREIERELGDIEVGVSGASNRPTGHQPRDPQSGRFMSQRGAEQRLVELSSDAETLIALAEQRNEILSGAEGGGPGGVSTATMIEIQRRTLNAQRDSADFDEERNVILEDMLDEIRDGADGGGGGGFLRTAGAAGLGARAATGTGLGAATLAGGPFAALAAFTLGTGALAATTGGEETTRPGPGPAPGEAPPTQPEGQRAVPVGTGLSPVGPGVPTAERGTRRTIPQEGNRPGDVTNVNIEANANVDAPSESLQRSEVQRFVQRRIRQAAEAIKSDLRRELGGDTSPRTTTRGGGGGATTGGRFRT